MNPQGIPVDETDQIQSGEPKLSEIDRVQLRLQAAQLTSNVSGSPAQRLSAADMLYQWLSTGELPRKSKNS